MFGYETSDRRRHSRDSIRKRLRIEWRFFVFLRGIFRLFKLEARNIELEFMEWKLDQFQRYRWFLSMEFVIRRWIFVWKGGLGIVQFGNGIGSLAFLLVMENTYILFLSHSFQLWTFRGIFKHFKPPLYFSFFLFFFFPIYHPRVFPPLLRKLWGLYRRILKYFFTLPHCFSFFNKFERFVTLVSKHYREPDNWGGRRNNALRFHNKGGVPQLWLQRLCGIINQIESMSPLWKADLATYSFIIIRGASVLPNLPPPPTSPTISPSFITPS